MALSAEFREQLLRRSRQLWEAREFTALVQALSPVERAELRREPALGYYLADAYHRLGERERALQLALQIAPACARRGNDRLFRERLNLEGVLRFGLGDTSGAEEAWSRLLEASMRADDEVFAGRANNNFGVLHTLRGDWQRALLSYGRATAAYQRLGYLRGLAQAHNNLAIAYREMERAPEADHHFLQAIAYARQTGSNDEEGRARIERSLLLCYAGDLSLAEATAQRALAAWERLGDPAHTGEAHRVLGIISLARRSTIDAEEHAEQALALASRARAALLEAETLELRAILFQLSGDADAAERARARAHPIFGAMGATSWGDQLRRRLESVVK